MSLNKKYWKSVEELDENSSIVKALQQNEFVEEIPVDKFLGDKETLETSSTSRRDFLKYVGFSTAAASLAACEGPIKKSIPYVVLPDEIIPGIANYYATTIADGFDFANILVKTREGRPIKIERNRLEQSFGSVNARVHASVLSMYDVNRLQTPLISNETATWEDFDSALENKLNALKEEKIVLLTQTFASPSTSKLIKKFTSKFPNVSHVIYDTVSSSEALDAFQSKYGVRALADFDFSKAKVIVSVGADFLGDWQGGGFDSSYAKGRIPSEGKMSQHFQFEANMSLTGANSDIRIPTTPSQQKQVVKALKLKKGTFGLMQPTIKPLFDTRQFQDSLLKLLGVEKSYYDFIKETWKESILESASWNNALHDGVFLSDVEIDNDEITSGAEFIS